jgi:RHS repeat-associated protein
MNSHFTIYRKTRAASRLLGRAFYFLVTLLSVISAKAQPPPPNGCVITGTSPVTVGDTWTYTISSACPASSWTATCGTIQSSTSTTVTVYFNVLGSCSSSTITAKNSSGTTLATKTVTVNQPPALVCGSISNPTQTINYNAPPAQINAGVSSGGNCGSSYNYQWYSSTNGTTYTAISGATSQNYQPGNLTVTTYYYRTTVCHVQNCTTSNTATVTVYPQVVGGSLSPTPQTINYNTTPSQLTLSGVSGGNGSYSYQWQSSTNSSFTSPTNVGTNSTTYQPPGLTVTTYYRVVVNSNGATANSASALVTVYPQLVPGTVTSSQTINYNYVPAQLNLTGISGGNGSYSYQWYYSNNGGSTWPQLSGITGSTYTPGALTATTEYEVIVTSNSVPATSGIATITVYPQLVTGTVSPATQTINYNTAPPTSLSVSGTTGGSGTYSYQWQSCLTSNGTYIAISGATASSYTPPALTATSYYELVTSSNGIGVTSSPVVINVYPQLVAEAITPSSLTLVSGTSPGLLTSTPTGGGCSGAYQYQWQSSTDDVTFSNISGATSSSYNPGVLTATVYYQVVVTCSGQIANSAVAQMTIGTPNSNLNYIRTRRLSKPGVTDTVTADGLTSTVDVQQSTTYFDGLGRSIQTVAKQASPLLNDVVSIQVYDPFGRQATSYLPYISPSATGNYKTDPLGEQSTFNSSQFPTDQFFYGQTSYEPSPLNRPAAGYAPGNSWVGSGRGVSQQYSVNGPGDSVQNWTISSVPESLPVSAGLYAASTLYENITTDEQGHQMVQYSDQQGHILLKKVLLTGVASTGPTGWLNTYYVYDSLENLRFVIPPAAVQWLQANSWNFATSGGTQVASGLCFRYEYDYRKRTSTKKVPGAGEVWMVYDGRDRLVMSQDSNLRVQGKWLVDEFDTQNRPDSSGLITDSHNQSYHQNLALYSSYYPVVASYPYQLQTETFYDNYSWVPTGGGLSATMNTSYSTNGSYFITGYNTSPTYAQPITYFPITRGHVAGTFAYVIGSTTGQVMTDVNFYDDRNRVIQTEDVNITGGVDLTTMQYDFSGKPLRALLIHNKSGTPVQQHIVVTKLSYDPAFRLKSIFKNIDGAASDQLIDSMQYNELGQLRAKYLGNNVDSLAYAYNIRGWLTGINPNYVAGTTANYFGMELGYDKSTSVAPGNTYMTQQYTGNIEGTVWKTSGSGINRKYDFSYDNVNRLTGANFNQYNGSGFDKSAKIDFSLSNLNYDANGNILTMTQQGFTVGGSNPIDSLFYSYGNGGISNQLAGVRDTMNNSTSLLGDFHYNPATKLSTDYSYDGNGNLRSDNNKAIDSIDYNYLNLPDSVHMKGKGYIVYTYDAKGTKWKKTITDSVARHSTTILYLGGFVYQQNDSITNPDGGSDTLQFVANEEGRARWAFQKNSVTGATSYSFQYDFFEKDHLGNTRMVLTQERDTTNYIATMEAAYRTTESQLFGNIASTCVAWTSMPYWSQNIPYSIRYPNGVNVNDSVSKVDYNGTSGQTTGPSLLLKVMAGDTIMPGVQCYYVSNTLTTTNPSFTSVLNSLASGILGTSTGAAEGTLAGYTSSSGPVFGAVNTFLSTKDAAPPAGYPKAYLNWILLDDQFNYVSGSSGSVATASTTYPANQMNPVAAGGPVVMSRNGYLYVWVSNETQGWDVFFDNLSVQYKQGPVLEENHYYPFGLTMAGLSDKAVKTQYAQNKFRYNGKELQNQEFSDGTGLEEYDYGARFQDPQLGVWHNIDPLADKNRRWSPYNYAVDNPIRFVDPDGMDVSEGGYGSSDNTYGSPMNDSRNYENGALTYESSGGSVSGGGGNGGVSGGDGKGGLNDQDGLGHVKGKEVDGEVVKEDDNPSGIADNRIGDVGMSAQYKAGGGGPKNDEKNKPKPKPKPKKQSTASKVLHGGSTVAMGVFLFGGGPPDVFTDAGAGTILLGTLLTAGVIYLFSDNSGGNENYPGPWTTTYEPPSQNPIHFQPSGMGNNQNLPDGWNNLIIKVGVTGLGAYYIYDTHNDYLTNLKVPINDKTTLKLNYPTLKSSH